MLPTKSIGGLFWRLAFSLLLAACGAQPGVRQASLLSTAAGSVPPAAVGEASPTAQAATAFLPAVTATPRAAKSPTPYPVPGTVPPVVAGNTQSASAVLVHENLLHALAFSPDGKLLAAGYGIRSGEVLVWDVAAARKGEQAVLHTLSIPIREQVDNPVESVAFSRRGSLVAAATQAGEAFVYDLASGKRDLDPFLTIHPVEGYHKDGSTGPIYTHLAFSPKEDLLAIAFNAMPESEVLLWDVVQGKLVHQLPVFMPLKPPAFSPDGRLLAVDGTGDIQVFETASGSLLFTCLPQGPVDKTRPFDVSVFAFTPDGSTLVGIYNTGRYVTWQTADGQVTGEQHTQYERMYTLAISAGGAAEGLFAMGTGGGRVLLGYPGALAEGGLQGVSFPESVPVYAVAFSPEGELLAAGGFHGEIRLWETRDLDLPAPPPAPAFTFLPTRAPVTPAPTTQTWSACPEGLSSQLKAGGRAMVSLLPPEPNIVREAPGRDSTKLGLIQPGEEVEILDGPACADGWVWWQVRSAETGLTGWTAEGDEDKRWLVPAR